MSASHAFSVPFGSCWAKYNLYFIIVIYVSYLVQLPVSKFANIIIFAYMLSFGQLSSA